MKLAVLGAGGMGRWSVTEFASNDEVDSVIVADISPDTAREVVANYGAGKARAVTVDVSDENRKELRDAITGCDAVVNCTQYVWNVNVMTAAAEVGSHYTDLGGLFHVANKQLELDDAFKRSDVTAVISMGAAPGMTNVLARYGARMLDTIKQAKAMAASVEVDRVSDDQRGVGWLPPYSLSTICDEFSVSAPQFIDGHWEDMLAGTGEELIDFGDPAGVLPAHYTIHSEPATFYHAWHEQGLEHATWKLALPTRFDEEMRFLSRIGMTRTDEVEVAGVKVRPRDVLLKVVDELPPDPRSSGNPTTIMIGVVRGLVEGREVEWRVRAVASPIPEHPNAGAGIVVGVPPAIVARMMAKGEIKGPGVFVPEEIVPERRLFSELMRWGFRFDVCMKESVV